MKRLGDIFGTSTPRERVMATVRREPGLTVPEWRDRLDPAERRALQDLLEGDALVLAPVQRADGAGRRYVRQGVYLAEGDARLALDRFAPMAVEGPTLSAARHYVGVGAAELGSRLGLAPSTVRDMEASPEVPRARLTEVVEALGLPQCLDRASIRADRLGAGLTQEEIAKRVGVDQTVYSGWENGVRGIPPGRMVALAAALQEARTASPGALEARRRNLRAAMAADIAAQPGITSKAVLHQHREPTLGRLGPRIDAAKELRDMLRTGEVAEAETTAVGPRGGARTVRGLFMAADAPAKRSRSRLTGDELRRRRWDVHATEQQVADLAGITKANLHQLESHGGRLVPLHWEEPLRAALRQLVDVPGPDDQARLDILEAVEEEPGITPFRMAAKVSRSKSVIRALKALVDEGELVEGPSWDGQGRERLGLYRPGSQVADDRFEPGELRRLRHAAGRSSTEMAKALGIHASRLTRWETGDRGCPAEWVARLRNVLAGPLPTRPPGRQLRRLLDLAARPGGIATGNLPTSFFAGGGPAVVAAAIEAGQIHVEERLVPDRRGRTYARRFLVAGPGETPPVDHMTAQELRDARKRARLSQTALAKRLGLSPSTVQKWEQQGHVAPGQVGSVRRALGGLFRLTAELTADEAHLRGQWLPGVYTVARRDLRRLSLIDSGCPRAGAL